VLLIYFCYKVIVFVGSVFVALVWMCFKGVAYGWRACFRRTRDAPAMAPPEDTSCPISEAVVAVMPDERRVVAVATDRV
jgi:hypothetical protein